MDGRRRVRIRAVSPEIDCGRFPIKRVVGEDVEVTANVFTDGHDAIAAVLRHQRVSPDGEPLDEWREVPMEHVINDRWRASFRVRDLGHHRYTIHAWIDRYATWRRDTVAKIDAGQDVSVELLTGAEYVREAVKHADGADAEQLAQAADLLGDESAERAARHRLVRDDELTDLVRSHRERRWVVEYPRDLALVVDREKARFSAWYELFPRSASPDPERLGTLRDVIDRLPYVAELGFDVLYLPPIHPIGEVNRKGPNNAVVAEESDPGSPWAIGSEHGGHKSVHPELGTLDDVVDLVQACREHGIELALDIAFQCAPDHPYVREHPEWFRKRADGSIQYAENPPKKYEDIYPFDFECEDWEALWNELKSVFEFWIDKGVNIFRVDNPHTKPFGFWEWVIAEIKRDHPQVLFLAEAFTRPAVMYELAKLGFSQSYTYFAWRNTKWELEEYFTELTRTPAVDVFRPNAWPNTPDILTEYLQYGGRPAFLVRLVLAATLSANYGIYGPPFELQRYVAREPGSEEYLDSEKYQAHHWDLEESYSLREMIARVNRARRDNVALHDLRNLTFHPVDNPEIICFSKASEDGSNVVLVVANVDPHWRQSGWVHLDLAALGVDEHQPFQVHDQLGDGRYLWHGSANYVELDPQVLPAHIMVVRTHVRTERDFAYYM